jgi:uncharacterized membrane protein YhaH (DUF805 family)
MSAIWPNQIEPLYVSPSLGNFLFSFHGRISRYHYWVQFFLPYIALDFIAIIIDLITGMYNAQTGLGLLSTIFPVLAIWPSLAINVKRCHDRDRSGWFLLVSLIPLVGVIWLFVDLGCLRGSIGQNRFGPDPVQPADR